MVDWFLGLLTPTQWDAWRNWLATLGGLVALLIAATTYRRSARIRREEQARLVYSKQRGSNLLGPGESHEEVGGDVVLLHVQNRTDHRVQYFAVIHNGSKELIGPARVEVNLAAPQHDARYSDIWATVGTIEPETDVTVSFLFDNHDAPNRPMFSTSLLFRDASGQWWRRNAGEPIERVHEDPANAGLSAGFLPDTPPPVTAQVRWHRFWRRARGKSPSP